MKLKSALPWLSLASMSLATSLPLAERAVAQAPVININQSQYAVVSPSYMRTLTTPFSPENATAPSIQVFSPDFYNILGSSPNLFLLASKNDTTGGAFAHEGATWVESAGEVYFLSNANKEYGASIGNYISKLSLKSFYETGDANVTTVLQSADSPLKNFNGATNYGSKIVITAQGQNDEGGGLLLLDPPDPANPEVILDNFRGRQFNSPNDVVVHPQSKALFFTDSIYGHVQGFRPDFTLPQQVYRFVPSTVGSSLCGTRHASDSPGRRDCSR
jgi:gluconolactonase